MMKKAKWRQTCVTASKCLQSLIVFTCFVVYYLLESNYLSHIVDQGLFGMSRMQQLRLIRLNQGEDRSATLYRLEKGILNHFLGGYLKIHKTKDINIACLAFSVDHIKKHYCANVYLVREDTCMHILNVNSVELFVKFLPKVMWLQDWLMPLKKPNCYTIWFCMYAFVGGY